MKRLVPLLLAALAEQSLFAGAVNPEWSIARQWDEEALRAIRFGSQRPPVRACYLYFVSVDEIPIYVDWDIFICGDNLTTPEREAFEARLDAVSTRFKFVSALPNYAAWVVSIDDLSDNYPSLMAGPIAGSMEVPWLIVLQWNAAYQDAIDVLNGSPAGTSTNAALVTWRANSNVQLEFDRQDINGGVTTGATLAQMKTAAAGLWNDAHDYACVTKLGPKATRCSQYGGLGVTMLEGTTRVINAGLHIVLDAATGQWQWTGDSNYHRPMELQFKSEGATGAALQSMVDAHAATDGTQPWLPSMYWMLPLEGWDDSIAVWTMGESAEDGSGPMHRKRGANIVDPPDFEPAGNLYWAGSTMRRFLSAASASLVAHTSQANAFGGGRHSIEPFIYASAVPPEMGTSELWTTNHSIGLWDRSPSARVQVYLEMFVPETDVEAGAANGHVNPTGLWFFDSADYYWIDGYLTRDYATADPTMQQKIEASRVGWEKMLGLLPELPLGGTSLGDTYWNSGSRHKFWTVAGGDQTGRGWNPFTSIIGQYLSNLADIGLTEIKHALAMWVSERNVTFAEELRAGLAVMGY